MREANRQTKSKDPYKLVLLPVIRGVLAMSRPRDSPRFGDQSAPAEYNADSIRSSKPLVTWSVTWIIACIKLSRL